MSASPSYSGMYVAYLLDSLLRFQCSQRWNGRFFESTTLKSLGLRVQLGHWHLRCINPIAGAEDFTVLHVNGIHKVAVDFCGCKHRVATRLQMLRF